MADGALEGCSGGPLLQNRLGVVVGGQRGSRGVLGTMARGTGHLSMPLRILEQLARWFEVEVGFALLVATGTGWFTNRSEPSRDIQNKTSFRIGG